MRFSSLFLVWCYMFEFVFKLKSSPNVFLWELILWRNFYKFSTWALHRLRMLHFFSKSFQDSYTFFPQFSNIHGNNVKIFHQRSLNCLVYREINRIQNFCAGSGRATRVDHPGIEQGNLIKTEMGYMGTKLGRRDDLLGLPTSSRTAVASSRTAVGYLWAKYVYISKLRNVLIFYESHKKSNIINPWRRNSLRNMPFWSIMPKNEFRSVRYKNYLKHIFSLIEFVSKQKQKETFFYLKESYLVHLNKIILVDSSDAKYLVLNWLLHCYLIFVLENTKIGKKSKVIRKLSNEKQVIFTLAHPWAQDFLCYGFCQWQG